MLSACVWTSDGGTTRRYVSSWQATTSTDRGAWSGEPVVVSGRIGSIIVRGVPGGDSISVSSTLVAGARSTADAEAAFTDVADSVSIELRDGTWFVECGEAAETHGSVVPSATGCDEMVLEIPQGSEGLPVSLRANTSSGGIHVSNVVVEDLELDAAFGLVADVTPVGGATLDLHGSDDLVSGMCSSWLRVPVDTGFESVALDVGKAELDHVGNDPNDPDFWLEVDIRGFDDAPTIPRKTPSYTWSRDTDGPLVQSAIVHAAIGKAILTTGPVPAPDELTLCASYELGQGWKTPD